MKILKIIPSSKIDESDFFFIRFFFQITSEFQNQFDKLTDPVSKSNSRIRIRAN